MSTGIPSLGVWCKKMIQLDIRIRTKNPTPTPSVVRNPTPTPPKSLRLCNPGLKYKRQRKYFCEELTVCHFATVYAAVKFVKRWMSSHFSSAAMVQPRDQNIPEWSAMQVMLAMGKRPKGRQRTWWRDYISDLTCSRFGVQPTEPSEIAERKTWYISCPPAPAASATLPGRKSGYVNEWMKYIGSISSIWC